MASRAELKVMARLLEYISAHKITHGWSIGFPDAIASPYSGEDDLGQMDAWVKRRAKASQIKPAKAAAAR